jgi:hypothetical protein
MMAKYRNTESSIPPRRLTNDTLFKERRVHYWVDSILAVAHRATKIWTGLRRLFCTDQNNNQPAQTSPCSSICSWRGGGEALGLVAVVVVHTFVAFVVFEPNRNWPMVLSALSHPAAILLPPESSYHHPFVWSDPSLQKIVSVDDTAVDLFQATEQRHHSHHPHTLSPK